jgi:hypothetical protein
MVLVVMLAGRGIACQSEGVRLRQFMNYNEIDFEAPSRGG